MQRLSVSELAQRLKEAPHSLRLLDVREPWELATARLNLQNAELITIPMGELPARLDELGLDAADAPPIVCLCHHGMRSAQVVAWLMSQGIEPVYNLSGGIDAWSPQIDPQVPRY